MPGEKNSIGSGDSNENKFNLTFDFSLADSLVAQGEGRVNNLVAPENPRDYRQEFAKSSTSKEVIKGRFSQIVQESTDSQGIIMDSVLFTLLRDSQFCGIINNNKENWNTIVSFWGKKGANLIIKSNLQRNQESLLDDYKLLLGLILELHEKLP